MTQNDFAIVKLSNKNRKIIKSIDSDITYFSKNEFNKIINNLQYYVYSCKDFSTVCKVSGIFERMLKIMF